MTAENLSSENTTLSWPSWPLMRAILQHKKALAHLLNEPSGLS